MSKYNSYAKRIDEIAKKNFAAYIDAKSAYDAAFDHHTKNPRPTGISDAATITAAARAEIDYHEKKEALDRVRRELNDSVTMIESLRSELSKMIASDFMANPDDLDGNTIELMRSGILSPEEFENLANKNANNHTMLRLIGSYAKQKVAEADRENDFMARRKLNTVVDMARRADGRAYLEVFDGIADTYNRCVRNPAMISFWDQLTSEAIERF